VEVILLKTVLKSILSGWLGKNILAEISREWSYIKKIRSGRYGRFNIDQKLESLLPHRDGFYVELGANDGALASNSYYFELKKNWRGILIEPVPNLFLSCLKRRGERNWVFCNACVPFDYKNKFVSMTYADSMSVSHSLDLDIGDEDQFIQSGIKFLKPGEHPFEFGAKAAVLNELLITGKAPKLIDFLSLDVEGAELDVLKGIDFNQFNFKFIVVECRNIERLEVYLGSHRYFLVDKLTHHDYLFEFKPTNTFGEEELEA
jgi:FkbM family methyltransferase